MNRVLIPIASLIALCLISVVAAPTLADQRERPVRQVPPPENPVENEEISAMALPPNASHIISTIRCTLVDTRLPAGPFGGPRMMPGLSRAFIVPNGPCPGIPVALGYALVFTAIGPDSSPVQLKAWATGNPIPATPTLTLNVGTGAPNTTAPRAAAVEAGSNGSIHVEVDVGTHLLIELYAYYTAEAIRETYIVEAPPALVGFVVALDLTTTDRLCRDKDGCEFTVQMVNFDAAGQPGSVASRTERFFVSQTSRWWRFSNNDLTGLDNNGVVNEWINWDCYFTDAETYGGSSNSRLDSAAGFGLLNIFGGGYSDATTICRVSIED